MSSGVGVCDIVVQDRVSYESIFNFGLNGLKITLPRDHGKCLKLKLVFVKDKFNGEKLAKEGHAVD